MLRRDQYDPTVYLYQFVGSGETAHSTLPVKDEFVSVEAAIRLLGGEGYQVEVQYDDPWYRVAARPLRFKGADGSLRLHILYKGLVLRSILATASYEVAQLQDAGAPVLSGPAHRTRIVP